MIAKEAVDMYKQCVSFSFSQYGYEDGIRMYVTFSPHLGFFFCHKEQGR